MKVSLEPGLITLDSLEKIYREKLHVEINKSFKDKVEAAAKIVKEASKGEEPVYGINTGFGKLASKKIPPEETEQLQRNLILSQNIDHVIPRSLKMAIFLRGMSQANILHNFSLRKILTPLDCQYLVCL